MTAARHPIKGVYTGSTMNWEEEHENREDTSSDFAKNIWHVYLLSNFITLVYIYAMVKQMTSGNQENGFYTSEIAKQF